MTQPTTVDPPLTTFAKMARAEADALHDSIQKALSRIAERVTADLADRGFVVEPVPVEEGRIAREFEISKDDRKMRLCFWPSFLLGSEVRVVAVLDEKQGEAIQGKFAIEDAPACIQTLVVKGFDDTLQRLGKDLVSARHALVAARRAAALAILRYADVPFSVEFDGYRSAWKEGDTACAVMVDETHISVQVGEKFSRVLYDPPAAARVLRSFLGRA